MHTHTHMYVFFSGGERGVEGGGGEEGGGGGGGKGVGGGDKVAQEQPDSVFADTRVCHVVIAYLRTTASLISLPPPHPTLFLHLFL